MKTFTIYLYMSAVGVSNFNKFLFQALLLGNLGLVSACGYIHVDMVSADDLGGNDNSYPPSATPIKGLRQQSIVATAGSSNSASTTIQMNARLQFTANPSKQLSDRAINGNVGASTGGFR